MEIGKLDHIGVAVRDMERAIALAEKLAEKGQRSQAGQMGQDEDEHETPGYLKQFEHFADGRTVAPSVIGADPTWNDR